MNKPLIVIALLSAAGCSNKAVYENMRIHQRNECFKEPRPLQEECLERANLSYEEYQRNREELSEE